MFHFIEKFFYLARVDLAKIWPLHKPDFSGGILRHASPENVEFQKTPKTSFPAFWALVSEKIRHEEWFKFDEK